MHIAKLLLPAAIAALTGISCAEPGSPPETSSEHLGTASEALNSLPVYKDPSASQVISQPTGTYLSVNNFSATNVSNANNTIYVDGVKYPRTTAGINAAIADAPSGGTVHLPAASYALTCPSSCVTNNAVILITKPLTLEGDGWGSALQPDSSVGSTVDIIHFLDPGIGSVLRNFAIIPSAGTPGRYGILIDTQNEAKGAANMVIDHVYVEQLGSAAISSYDTVQDGFYIATIQHSRLTGGILLTGTAGHGVGDTIRIIGNEIRGSGWGVNATFQPGASSLVVQQNNITNALGGIYLGAYAVSARILENEIETESNFTGSCLIDIEGTATGPAVSTLISGNSIQIPTPIVADGIRVNYASGTTIKDNLLEQAPGKHDIVLTANASSTFIGNNIDSAGHAIADMLSDAGTGTFSMAQNTKGLEVVGNMDGRGSFKLAAEAACLATGTLDRFTLWSAGTSQTCAQACAAVSCATAGTCVEGWSMFAGSTSYRYGTECTVADPSVGQGISGKFCCCTGTGCGQAMYH